MDKMKVFTKCKVCGDDILDDFGYLENNSTINVFFNQKIKGTYCSLKCLKKDFYSKINTITNRFLFLKDTEEKVFWINKKHPSKKFEVIFLDPS